MVKDLFERIQNNKGPWKWVTGRRIFCFSQIRGELDPECSHEEVWIEFEWLFRFSESSRVRKADTDAAIKIRCSVSHGSSNDEWAYKIPWTIREWIGYFVMKESAYLLNWISRNYVNDWRIILKMMWLFMM
jgi:hypothetical protein